MSSSHVISCSEMTWADAAVQTCASRPRLKAMRKFPQVLNESRREDMVRGNFPVQSSSASREICLGRAATVHNMCSVHNLVVELQPLARTITRNDGKTSFSVGLNNRESLEMFRANSPGAGPSLFRLCCDAEVTVDGQCVLY